MVTGPLAIVTIVATTIFWINDTDWYKAWPQGLLLLCAFLIAFVGVFNFTIKRNIFTVFLTDIPLLLAFYFLPPTMVILMVGVASLLIQFRTAAVTKRWFNVAKSSAAVTFACIALAALPGVHGGGPAAWAVLAAAVFVNTLVELLSITGVMGAVQGLRSAMDALLAGVPALGISAVNVAISLVILAAITATKWSVVPLAVLIVALALVQRSFTEFFRQHRTLSDVYELTKAVRNESTTSGLPDALLGRVQALMRAEYATLWVAAQGRNPEVLLTARVENEALLDLSPVPVAVRMQATADGTTVAVGPRFPDTENLRPTLREFRVKDAIVVPLRSGQTVIGTLEVVNRIGDSRTRTFRDADVQVLETIAAHVAVAVENSRLVDRLRYDAYHDRLTGLPNRRRVTDALAESVKVRAEDEVVAVLLFDVDGQRDVNESMGHGAGDKLLAQVAEKLRGIAGPGALVGRIGGDEFVVTLRAESTDATVRLATEMREQLRGSMTVGALTLDLDTAVGVSVYPDHGGEPEMLLQRAELAANAAKVLPYGVQLFHPALESRAVRRLGIASDLRQALENNELDVYFQPKVTLADRHLVGVECLARWTHPAHGEVAPEDFVAVAEHTGQLSRLTEQVLTAGLRRCREWADADRPLSIAVNLSVRTLLDSRFPDQVAELLERYGVAAAQVTFEISEPGMLGDIERVLPTLYRLRDLGVRLSVDDFGTGASSLSYLRQWPVHEVKIDDSFVQGMATDSGDLAIVRAVVSLSREFGLTVVAEGVESELTLDLLEEMGCEIGQGYLFSRPLPYERLEAWFSAQTEPESTPTGEVRRLRAVI
ncbi:bifunctional diguanylate cyclase/phosphodiesterase [Paractinoplanes rishiriensis]|uniref:Bifunctional diguanylate cyclase/phosphodiesterase n=1 Tax=Paractinoplanes rishiriensis TaxID=1050105 RepID=A0A919JZ55_9ACTN|nr:bifunctional diguanylate cyclase/phosphodiesterase [Actinoplanes rishiriensis]